MTKLCEIKGFNKPLLANLNKLGIDTTQALLLHLPIRYIDETRIVNVRDLRIGELVQVEGEIVHAEVTYKPRKSLIARLADETGQINLRFIHFYPSQIHALKVGEKIRAMGEVRHGFYGYEMVHPTCKKTTGKTVLPETLTPVYPTVAGLTQAQIRKAIGILMNQNEGVLNHSGEFGEFFTKNLYKIAPNLTLPSFIESLQYLHFPPQNADLMSIENHQSPHWQRLAFDELLAQQLSMRKHYAKRFEARAPPFAPSKTLISSLLKKLPFALTQAQQKVSLEIEHDLSKPYPMQRLLQGDVGSGKTIVACMAALQAIENGWQVALMAPTEILAEQHFNKLAAWLSPLGVDVAWLTGSQLKKERNLALDNISNGQAKLIIGTHAIFQESVIYRKLGLAIIDEQHRFGVQQRLALRRKGFQLNQINNMGDQSLHQLMMSATPIPRTLSMSYYADLDVSVIDELPPGRTPVVTKLISDVRRDEILVRVREACQQGQQAYWVCPLIEESEVLQLATANETFENMRNDFPELTVGLVHGRMKAMEKQAIMQSFSSGECQLLVATTVIEVGVDVPNASLMVIEHAERMGLSQLHQLRGRVGRGAAKSTCILLYQTKLSETARARLKVIYESTDGFEIAQADLNIRGPGEFLGVRQSGVPMLKIADLNRDEYLLSLAKTQADDLIKHHPEAVEKHLERWMGNRDELIKV
jgi:ATP-dependent DNA helicase RecG